MVLEVEGSGPIEYEDVTRREKVEVEVAHLGRALEISIQDSGLSGLVRASSNFLSTAFSNLVLKTHI